jgi:hypothetical protein
VGEDTTCERCGKPGRRLRGRVAPEGWYFGAFSFGGEGDHRPGEQLIVHVCSIECRDAVWTMQAGHTWDAVERRVNVPDEIRRYTDVVANRLRKEAAEIRACVWPSAGHEKVAASIVARLLETAAGEMRDQAETECEYIAEAQGSAGAGGA